MNGELVLGCPGCGRPLPEHCLTEAGGAFCPRCRTDFEVVTFPTLSARPTVEKPGVAVPGTDATCFFHAQNQAVAVCENCGRFLCAVCRIDYGGRVLCAECVGGKTPTSARPENQRVLYGGIALSLSVLPLLFWPVTLVTAPGVLCLVVWAWRRPRSLVQRRRTRLVMAGLIASAQLALWAFVFLKLILK